eukprot:5489080-Amphidinium_carterae.1
MDANVQQLHSQSLAQVPTQTPGTTSISKSMPQPMSSCNFRKSIFSTFSIDFDRAVRAEKVLPEVAKNARENRVR